MTSATTSEIPYSFRILWSGCVFEASEIGSDDAEARSGERWHLITPQMPVVREAVEQEHRRPASVIGDGEREPPNCDGFRHGCQVHRLSLGRGGGWFGHGEKACQKHRRSDRSYHVRSRSPNLLGPSSGHVKPATATRKRVRRRVRIVRRHAQKSTAAARQRQIYVSKEDPSLRSERPSGETCTGNDCVRKRSVEYRAADWATRLRRERHQAEIGGHQLSG